jgi:hypothetical protein
MPFYRQGIFLDATSVGSLVLGLFFFLNAALRFAKAGLTPNRGTDTRYVYQIEVCML